MNNMPGQNRTICNSGVVLKVLGATKWVGRLNLIPSTFIFFNYQYRSGSVAIVQYRKQNSNPFIHSKVIAKIVTYSAGNGGTI